MRRWHCRTINAKNALLRVIYDENLQPRVFGTVDGGEMLDMVITKDLGPMKTDDLTIQMSDSSFSNFRPSRSVRILCAELCVRT